LALPLLPDLGGQASLTILFVGERVGLRFLYGFGSGDFVTKPWIIDSDNTGRTA